MDEKERYHKGLETRREVLGKEHVDRAQANLSEFNGPFQELITRYAWGEIWERAGLTRRERSLITLAMLVALNREAEFRMHVRAALSNGVTTEEIREVLIHAGIYCGLPAANAAIQAAEQVIKETKARSNSS
ncbi:MAG: 4-carboxymuconolactone decarboxylase [Verrucomicrobia bacterium]|nr:4-carboxymuconolactone decarboxylase [Verrucomicrobiota bacterium]MBV8486150.1 4-carboxymuconolactone decarboxylase [Verrucomicrobiota bacterium]